MRMSARIRYAAALSAVALVTSAGAASAHHCYKEEWAEAAHRHHLAGGTAWVPLSDMAMMFVVPPGAPDECADVVDMAVTRWMEAMDLDQEPLIHSRTTVGSGAHKKGKEPKPINYLEESDFGMLVGLIADGNPGCLALEEPEA